MTQLSDDCFAGSGALTALDEALAQIRTRTHAVVGVEELGLADAAGRILAHDLIAPRDIPPYANSAVDGYAVYADDLAPDRETRLPLRGRAAAGHPLSRPQQRGEAVRIFTGAMIPAGADGPGSGPDCVMMQEDCREDGDAVIIRPGITRGANCRAAGEDVTAGSRVLAAGTCLRAPELGMVAALGLPQVAVRESLAVALFSTGDELAEPGAPLALGRIYDSNRHMIAASLRQLGCRVTDLGILPDSRNAVRAAVRRAMDGHHAIISTGGMSMGAEDHVRAVITELGRLDFWRLAIKPGRPVGLGVLRTTTEEKSKDGDNGVAYLGLPGNPVAAMTTFFLLARPLLQSLQGATITEPLRQRVCLGFSHRKKAGRREYVRARLTRPQADAPPVAEKYGQSGAGILSSLIGAHGFVEFDEASVNLEKGTGADFLSLAEFFA